MLDKAMFVDFMGIGNFTGLIYIQLRNCRQSGHRGKLSARSAAQAQHRQLFHDPC
jgi:hypothetical protein